jgi:hypothetical protein
MTHDSHSFPFKVLMIPDASAAHLRVCVLMRMTTPQSVAGDIRHAKTKMPVAMSPAGGGTYVDQALHCPAH